MYNSVPQVIAKTKKWGNSMGVIIPKGIGVSLDEEIIMDIRPRIQYTHVKDLRGKLKVRFDTGALMRQIDNELWGDE